MQNGIIFNRIKNVRIEGSNLKKGIEILSRVIDRWFRRLITKDTLTGRQMASWLQPAAVAAGWWPFWPQSSLSDPYAFRQRFPPLTRYKRRA